MSSPEFPASLHATADASTPIAKLQVTEIAADEQLPEMPPRAERKTGRVAGLSAKSASASVTSKLTARERSIRDWIPVILGVGLGIAAPLLSTLLEPMAPWGARLMFPFAQLVGLPEIGLSDELRHNLPQLMLYLQFPLEGLLVRSSVRRGRTLPSALGQIVFLHVVGALVLWLVSMAGQS